MTFQVAIRIAACLPPGGRGTGEAALGPPQRDAATAIPTAAGEDDRQDAAASAGVARRAGDPARAELDDLLERRAVLPLHRCHAGDDLLEPDLVVGGDPLPRVDVGAAELLLECRDGRAQ